MTKTEQAARELADQTLRAKYRADFDPDAHPEVHAASVDATWRDYVWMVRIVAKVVGVKL